VIEAMASGLPCVVFDIPGVTRDIISSDQDGIIIPGEDVQGFATAINRILNEPAWADQLGEAARRAVLERYAMPAVARRYQEMYRKMLFQPPTSVKLPKS
jgi:glycosyltransferase involved in cell wall biosynthesis